MNMNSDCRIGQIAVYYGLERQAEKTIEEMAELTVEIKHLRKKGEFDAFIEELVDTKIMVDQLLSLVTHNGEHRKVVDEMYEYKVDREMRRMDNDRRNAVAAPRNRLYQEEKE